MITVLLWAVAYLAIAVATAAAYSTTRTLVIRHQQRAAIRAQLRRLGQVERDIAAARAARAQLLAAVPVAIPNQRRQEDQT